MKKVRFFALILLTAMMVTGCRFVPMTRLEVYNYVRSRTGRVFFTMEKEKKDSSSEVMWHVHCVSDGLDFDVRDSQQFEIVYAERHLSDNYMYSLVQAHIDELDLGDGIEFVCEEGNTFYDYDNYFTVYYSDYDDLLEKYERITKNAGILDSYSKDFKIRYFFYYWPDERKDEDEEYPVIDYSMATECKEVCFTELKDKSAFDGVRLSLLGFAYRYRFKEFDSILSEMDDRDYDMIFYYEGSIYDTVITKDDGSSYISPRVTTGYNDMLIGELYNLCKQENVEISGDGENFCVKSPSGDEYRFSYEYVSGHQLFYYKNDEIIAIDDDDFLIGLNTVSEICGFDVSSRRHEYTTG